MWRRTGATQTAPSAGDELAGEDDLALVRRAVLDHRDFAPLYEKYLIRVHRRCRQRLSNPDEAWDATATAFHKALAGLDGFRGGSFEGWLFRIADRACVDAYRRRRPSHSIEAGLELATANNGPEATVLMEMDLERLEWALAQLPERRALTVRLRLEGLKGAEIAERLGVSHASVRQEHVRALRQLADLLDDGDGREGGNG